MKSDPEKLPLVLIAGPTASGKSALALALSRSLPVTIINADASQVYRDLAVISARPSPEEQRLAPHRLFGHIDGAQSYSAAAWAADARAAISKVQANWRVPVLVGGTGLYIRTLLGGIAPVPAIDPDVRKTVRALSVGHAHAALTSEDPAAAARLSPNDTTRVARALEVVRSTGQPIAHWQSQRVGGIADTVRLVPMVLLPPREWLFARSDTRFEAMLAAGGKEEVSALIARGLDPDLPVMRAIGVREIAEMLANPADSARCIADAKVATRQYAKRQFTWFRNQPPPDWTRIEAQLDNDIINDLAIKLQHMALTD
jgi:tRNA dimethylallyltransferase